MAKTVSNNNLRILSIISETTFPVAKNISNMYSIYCFFSHPIQNIMLEYIVMWFVI